MKGILLSLLHKRSRFVLYCIIGVTGVTVDYVSFYAMVNWLAVNYLIANVVSTSLGIVNNFALNRSFNFKVQDRLWARFASFYCVGLAGLLVSSLILFICVSRLGLNPNYSKAFTLIVVVALQYNLNRLISFRQ